MPHYIRSKMLTALAVEKPFIRLSQSLTQGYAVIAGNHVFDRSSQCITVYSFDDRHLKKLKIAAIIESKEWPDNVLLDAIKRSNLFAQPEAKAPLSVCLDRWYDAKDLITVGDINLWQRTLLGDHVNYCAELDGSVCHAATLRAAVAGLDNQRTGESLISLKDFSGLPA